MLKIVNYGQKYKHKYYDLVRNISSTRSRGIPPLPLNAEQTSHLCEMLQNPPEELKEELMMLLCDRTPD